MEQPIIENRPLDLRCVHDADRIAALQERVSSGGTLMVKAFGISMHPFIRGGEIIAVRAISLEQLRLGDVVFFHHKNRLYAHRLIRIDRSQSESSSEVAQLMTKGDTLRYADEPISATQLIGKVVAIYRSGQIVSLCTRRVQRLGRLMARFSFIYSTLFDCACSHRGRWITRLARFRLYRVFRRGQASVPVMCRPYDSEDFERLAALLADGSAAGSMDKYRERARQQIEQIAERNATLMIAERGPALVGSFVGGLGILEQDFGVGGWWIMGLYVRSTHRGLGVGEALTQALIEQARCENAEAVYCNVFVTNIPSKRLFEKLGFIPAEKEIQEKLNQAYQQISTSMPETIVLKYPLVQTDTEKGD